MLHVIYDDQCGFCIRSLKVCRALDTGKRLQFQGSSTFRLKPEATSRKAEATSRNEEPTLRVDSGGFRLQPEEIPELADADFENAMFAVTPDGRVTRGFFAFRRIAREVPLMWPLLPLLYFPGSGLIGPLVYAWVARNRRRFGCESEVCDLPAPGRRGL